jgi:hypothetical protein
MFDFAVLALLVSILTFIVQTPFIAPVLWRQ